MKKMWLIPVAITTAVLSLMISLSSCSITLSLDEAFLAYLTNSLQQSGISSYNIKDTAGATVCLSTNPTNATNGNTADGVVKLTVNLIAGLDNARVKVILNGQSISNTAVAGVVTCSLPLRNGDNTVKMTVYENGIAKATSVEIHINSTTPTTLWKFQLYWDNYGDLDLQADDGAAGRRVYWGSKTYNSGGWNYSLDIDETYAWGPENINIYSTASGQVRVFVNYYAAKNGNTAPVNAWVYVYSNNNYLRSYPYTFATNDIVASSSFDNVKSWVVKTLNF